MAETEAKKSSVVPIDYGLHEAYPSWVFDALGKSENGAVLYTSDGRLVTRRQHGEDRHSDENTEMIFMDSVAKYVADNEGFYFFPSGKKEDGQFVREFNYASLIGVLEAVLERDHYRYRGKQEPFISWMREIGAQAGVRNRDNARLSHKLEGIYSDQMNIEVKLPHEQFALDNRRGIVYNAEISFDISDYKIKKAESEGKFGYKLNVKLSPGGVWDGVGKADFNSAFAVAQALLNESSSVGRNDFYSGSKKDWERISFSIFDQERHDQIPIPETISRFQTFAGYLSAALIALRDQRTRESQDAIDSLIQETKANSVRD